MTIMSSFEIAISPIDSWHCALLNGEITVSNEVLKAIYFDLELSKFGRPEQKFGNGKPNFGPAEIRPKLCFFVFLHKKIQKMHPKEVCKMVAKNSFEAAILQINAADS